MIDAIRSEFWANEWRIWSISSSFRASLSLELQIDGRDVLLRGEQEVLQRLDLPVDRAEVVDEAVARPLGVGDDVAGVLLHDGEQVGKLLDVITERRELRLGRAKHGPRWRDCGGFTLADFHSPARRFRRRQRQRLPRARSRTRSPQQAFGDEECAGDHRHPGRRRRRILHESERSEGNGRSGESRLQRAGRHEPEGPAHARRRGGGFATHDHGPAHDHTAGISCLRTASS